MSSKCCFGAQPHPGYFRGEKVWHSRSVRQAHCSICNIPARGRLEKDRPKLPTSKAQGMAFHLVPTPALEAVTQHPQFFGKMNAAPNIFSVVFQVERITWPWLVLWVSKAPTTKFSEVVSKCCSSGSQSPKPLGGCQSAAVSQGQKQQAHTGWSPKRKRKHLWYLRLEGKM